MAAAKSNPRARAADLLRSLSDDRIVSIRRGVGRLDNILRAYTHAERVTAVTTIDRMLFGRFRGYPKSARLNRNALGGVDAVVATLPYDVAATTLRVYRYYLADTKPRRAAAIRKSRRDPNGIAAAES